MQQGSYKQNQDSQNHPLTDIQPELHWSGCLSNIVGKVISKSLLINKNIELVLEVIEKKSTKTVTDLGSE